MRIFRLIGPYHLNGKVKVVMAVMLLATALVITGFVWANAKISILVDGKKIYSNAGDLAPKLILENAGVYLGAKDEFRVIDNVPGKGSTIEVYRAIPVIVVQGQKMQVSITGKPTVGEVAASLGYGPLSYRTVPDPSTRPEPSMQIRILTLSDKVVEKELPVPFSVVRQPDPTMEKWMEAVVEAGVEGKKIARGRQLFDDGQEAGFEVSTERITLEPKSELVRVGTRESNEPSRGTVRFRKFLVMEASAYTPFDDGQSGITASGIPAKQGVVAVDPKVIPLGSRVFIPGYGSAVAADTGGAIKGAKIDLCIEDYGEAIRFGRRAVEVYVLTE